MSIHVFVDESKARGFLLAAALVRSHDLAGFRAEISALRMRHQRRLHFASESDRRRKLIVGKLTDLGVHARIYDATSFRNGKDARDATLAQLSEDLVAMGAARLVLERDDSTAASDRRIIRERLQKAGCHDSLRYEHLRAHEECLLSIPDAVAWCWARAGQWKERARSLVTDVNVVNPA